MKLTESEYRRIYAMSYGGKSASYSVEPHKCRIERRKAKIKGDHVEVEWRH